ncbi:MAG: prolipoprotein diacylglyceryl transferase [Cyclobacteriaceae bacterium]|nr:prolipoprotein diacylglyceryl transferase [Cyclobacteriaceae bacterium]
MHPVLFQIGDFTIYSYGFCIALGAVLGFTYMAWQGKKQFGLTLDQSNSLFLLLVTGGVVGGKLFTIFENPLHYLRHPAALVSGSGFVFYGSLLTCVPIMLWFFKRHRVPVWAMLDVMAVVTCIVHGFGRIGCFMAGCCYGLPTDGWWGVMFTDPACQAEPLNTPLHPTQLLEAAWIFAIMTSLLILKQRKAFDGQLFLLYLILYAAGRGVLELLRGDLERGFIIENYLSISQFISLLVIGVALYFYLTKRKINLLSGQ